VNLSDKGLAFIGGWEGFVGHPYNDAAGNATVGFGHLIHVGPVTEADVQKWGTLSRDAGLHLLRSDAALAEQAVNQLVTRPLGQGQFDSLTSFTFNVGRGGFQHSTLLQDVNRRLGPAGAARLTADFLRWDHAGGVEIPGLRRRRESEARLFLQGDYTGNV
jgi:lysozyme